MKGEFSISKSIGFALIVVFIIAIGAIVADLSIQSEMKMVLGLFATMIVIALLFLMI